MGWWRVERLTFAVFQCLKLCSARIPIMMIKWVVSTVSTCFFNLFKYIWADFLKPSTRHNQTGSEWLFFQTIRLGIFVYHPNKTSIFLGSLGESPQQTQHFFGRILPTFSGTISGARPGSCAQCTSMACPRIPPCRRFLWEIPWWDHFGWMVVTIAIYPLVNVYITMEHHHFFNG